MEVESGPYMTPQTSWLLLIVSFLLKMGACIQLTSKKACKSGEFDEVLGPHIRRWAYCHLLYHKGIYTLLSQRSSFLEKTAGFLLLPVIRGRIHKLVGCHTPNAKERSLDMIVKTFDKVNAALADGRPYICGDTFSAADLTFAALAGPAILPARYGAKLPRIEDIPREMAENVSFLRETAAGKHILRLYNTHRYKSAT